MKNYHAPGDWNVITDCCGMKRKFSQCIKQHDGLIVCPEHYDPRHPLDFVKSTHDDQRVPVARPESPALYRTDLDGTVDSTNVITNGTFAADSSWTKGTGWTIAAGVASCDGTQSDSSTLFQNGVLSPGLIYQVTFTISGYTAGWIYGRCGSNGYGTKRFADGTYVERIASIGRNGTRMCFEASGSLQGDTAFIGSIDTVTAYLVTY